MTESRHLFNSLLRIAARPIHHNAAIPIETRSGVRCRGRTGPDVHLADPVSNAAAGISAALRDLVFQYAAEVIRLLVKVSVELLSGPVVLFARNRLCALVRPGLAVEPATILDRMLDANVKL